MSKKSKKSKKKKKKLTPSLGYSPAQETASGAGTHGGGKKQRRKRERKQAKEDLRWEKS